jgi:hypothetical protein
MTAILWLAERQDYVATKPWKTPDLSPCLYKEGSQPCPAEPVPCLLCMVIQTCTKYSFAWILISTNVAFVI